MEDILEFGSKMREPPFANSDTFPYKMTDDETFPVLVSAGWEPVSWLIN